MRMATSDNALAERAGGGDRDAFRVLLERHYDRMYRLAYRYCGRHADAEDITQDICLALPGKLRSFQGSAQFTTWLYRVVLNAAKDWSRRAASADRAHEAFAEVSDLSRGAEAETAERMAWVYEALGAMNEDLRATALLVLAEGLSHREAADVLDVKESTVSWRMHEIRNSLKRLVEAG